MIDKRNEEKPTQNPEQKGNQRKRKPNKHNVHDESKPSHSMDQGPEKQPRTGPMNAPGCGC